MNGSEELPQNSGLNDDMSVDITRIKTEEEDPNDSNQNTDLLSDKTKRKRKLVVIGVKRRRRRREELIDECTEEEMEVMKQKYKNREDIWDETTGRFVCPKNGCNRSYGLVKDLYNHLRANHRMPKIGYPTQEAIDGHTQHAFDATTNFYICAEDNCNQTFEKQMNFYNHLIRDHSKRRQIVCKLCGKEFPKTQNLTTHMRRHTNTKPYSCHFSGCEYRCCTKTQLTQHLSTHSDVTPFECDYMNCNKKFKSRKNLRRHALTHDPNAKFQCTVEGCDQLFKNTYWRSIHVNSVHKGLPPELCKMPVKMVRCDWPGCEFVSHASSTAVHKSIHTGEKPFACDWPNCGKRFRNSMNKI
ncbi:unnamed protein product [Oppiella nova]|uniref:C2H2-type domain-containing protein n=1 Tax=Oppiella nova TaxID=334625 RepID=A0A7R9QQV8_9ACAR|nr:unnamed protein product [Oppiella nova]CAG2172151.1 unnamed protein product [Oppiella nova]